jgi:hypothetical protein
MIFSSRYNLTCPSDHTFSELNMKRKALTLQYKQNAYEVSKKDKFKRIVRGKHNNNTPTTSCIIKSNYIDGSPASTNNVPGDKSFMIINDDLVPIYNYIPVKRTYRGGANKYPYTAWTYGQYGFAVGSKGSNPESRAAAQRNLIANSSVYNRLALTSCPIILD